LSDLRFDEVPTLSCWQNINVHTGDDFTFGPLTSFISRCWRIADGIWGKGCTRASRKLLPTSGACHSLDRQIVDCAFRATNGTGK
jgi:hypothetical protein